MTVAAPRIRFHHVSLSVADLATQCDWYRAALGFTEVIERYELSQPPVHAVVLQAGNGVRIELIELIQPAATRVDTA